ncbi:MAG: hypothetical protein RLZZ276_1069, partial [Pseudomonadota bacterium]
MKFVRRQVLAATTAIAALAALAA